MSFMPSPGSVVRLSHGTVGIVTKVTPDGSDDRVWIGGPDGELHVTYRDIEELIHDSDDWKHGV